jgi:anti-anti-sigma factor
VRDGLAVVAVIGELDIATAPRLADVLGRLADPGRVILVDLSDTKFMDCAGVDVLARSHERQCHLGGELLLDSPAPVVSRVLECTHFDKMITILHGPESSSLLDGCSPSPRIAQAGHD